MSGPDPRTETLNWSDLGVSELPTGTVTLLLADVEGSTAAVGDAARRDDRCRRTPRPRSDRSRRRPPAGCGRSNRARATASWSRSPAPPTRWRVRWNCSRLRWLRSGCGSACTPARCRLRDEGNYIGPTINRTARLRDLAHGGQTVLSGATEPMVLDHLPADAWLIDLGTHPLRDLPRPERAVQLCHPDVHNDFPPLRVVG